MTLAEAVASGKAFRRTSIGGDFYTFDEYTEEYGMEKEDILATDYELAPDRSVTLTKADFDAAWNTARTGSLAIKPAGQSDFYKKLATHLGIV